MNNDTRTIILTNRPPVQIRKDDWPRIAKATSDSWGPTCDPARHSQALSQGEVDEYFLGVRQHEDGRAIVYGVFNAGPWTGSEDRREGEVLSSGDDIAAAVRRVGERCDLPDAVIRECIADLPTEEL